MFPSDVAAVTAMNVVLKSGVDDTTATIIWFKLTATAPGYIALALPSASDMVDLDIVMFTESSTEITATD